MISYAKLPFPFDVATIKEELSSFSGSWSSHFNTKHYEGGWKVLPLVAPDGNSKSSFSDLLGSSVYANTPEMGYFPSVKKLLDKIECEKMSVRFLNLQAGSFIKEHKDHDLSFEQGEARLHLPVFTNAKVYFFIEQERVIMNEGECWYINANLLHNVENKGTENRIHLVIDCKVNDWLQKLMENSEKKYGAAVNENKDADKIIAALRLMNTSTALQLADEMERKMNEQ